MSEASESRSWYRGTLILVAVLVVGRLVLEVAGANHASTRFLSSSVALLLAAIYLGAVAPLRGVTRFAKLIVPAIVLGAWTAGWVILATFVSGALRLERSHFAEPTDYGDWGHLGRHILEHVISIPILAVLVLILMAVPFLLWRWPVTVGPAAILGVLVITRYWVEAMGLNPDRAAAWSSTVAVLVSGLYLGGVGPRMGVSTARQLFVPAIVIGWVWRFWVFLAAVLSATVPFYQTHFFDPSQGRVVVRLARLVAAGAIEGFVAGVLLWGIAVWISRGTRQPAAA